MVYDFLEQRQAFGQSAAVSSAEIMRGCAIGSKRELCSAVERERRAGLPVLSTKRGQGGYYLPGDSLETAACVKWLRSEAAAINDIADALEGITNAGGNN